jgi:hypothetical protein
MRSVITPVSARAAQAIALTPEQKQQWDEAQAKREAEVLEKKQRIEEALAAALEPFTERERKRIRLEVALCLPNRPMLPEEVQDWLDERLIGVCRYAATGKIT